MDELYDIAISEIRKLQNTPKFLVQSETKEIKGYFKLNGSKITRNLFNMLPLNDIEDLVEPSNLGEALDEFIRLLEILKELDSKFKKLIKEYSNTNKISGDYERIERELYEAINNSKFDQNISENPKKILREGIRDLFSNKYQRSSLSNMHYYFYNKLFAYISEYYTNLLDEISDYYIRELLIDEIKDTTKTKEFIREKRKESKSISNFLNVGTNFTFLSYAFRDKLVSLLLFLKARSVEAVLFVDWMYSEDYSGKTEELKQNLSYFLKQSNKMIFLQSLNSELNTKPRISGLFADNKKMVRQWCSWEIGHFYKDLSNNEINTRKYVYPLHEDVYNNVGNTKSIEKEIKENTLLSNFEVIRNADFLVKIKK